MGCIKGGCHPFERVLARRVAVAGHGVKESVERFCLGVYAVENRLRAVGDAITKRGKPDSVWRDTRADRVTGGEDDRWRSRGSARSGDDLGPR